MKGDDWLKFRLESSGEWVNFLTDATNALFAEKNVELAAHNDAGYFHRLQPKYFEIMKAEWQKEGRAPAHWISKGQDPGIWTALFSPHNTYFGTLRSLHLVRFYFKPGYYIFNVNIPSHYELQANWKPEENYKNPWASLVNDRGRSLEDRMPHVISPGEKAFYEQNSFGAVLHERTFPSVIIVLEEAIERAEFFKL